MDNNFNEADSLKLINRMIAQTRDNFQARTAGSFLYWGYIIAALAIANFILLQVLANPVNSYYVWTLSIVAFIGSYLLNLKKYKKATHITHLDSIIYAVWIGFAISCVIVVFSIYTFGYSLKSGIPFLLINPIILTLTGINQYITAKICRFKPYTYAALFFWFGAILSVLLPLLFNKIDVQFIILALCMITGFIIPGHLANKKTDKNV